MEPNHKKIKKLKIFLPLIIIASILLGGVFLLTKSNLTKAYVFSVDGKSYTKEEVNEITEFPTRTQSVSREDAAREAFEALKKIAAAKQMGIELDQKSINNQKNIFLQEVDLEAGPDGKLGNQYDTWFDIFTKVSLIDKILNSNTPLGYKGYSFYFYFGQHIQYGPDYKPPGLNDPKLIKSDKDYAKNKAQEYNKKIINGQITPQELLKTLNKDKRFGPFGHKSLKFGNNPEVVWYEQGLDEPIIKTILNQKKTGASERQTGRYFLLFCSCGFCIKKLQQDGF
jgi:hypothetical protein